MPDRVGSCILLLTLFLFLSALIPVADLGGIDAQSKMMVLEPEKRGMLLAGTPHGPIAIDGDANFSDTALLEGWLGDGSPENPYSIDGYDIDLGGEGGPCIFINNTRVSFIIRNCNITGAIFGILLENVTNGELVNNFCYRNEWPYDGIRLEDSHFNTVVNNTCNYNFCGIRLSGSSYNRVANNTCSLNDIGIFLSESSLNTVANNTCTSNMDGIRLYYSDSNTMANNTCTSNTAHGIYLYDSGLNTVANNTCYNNNYGFYLDHSGSNTASENICNNNRIGIHLYLSDSNTMANNTCSINDIGIELHDSDSNTVTNNICNSNKIGIYLNNSDWNAVVKNTCLNNAEHDIYLYDSDSNTVMNNITTGFYSRLLLFGGVLFLLPLCIVVLGSRWHIASAIIQRTRYRLVFWFHKRKGGPDDIIVPTRYRLVSWLRKRRSLEHVDIDETHEPDSSDQ